MDKTVPTADEVRAWLEPMDYRQLNRLSELSGVSFHTLLKIRDRTTPNPRINTVAEFATHVQQVRVEASGQAA